MRNYQCWIYMMLINLFSLSAKSQLINVLFSKEKLNEEYVMNKTFRTFDSLGNMHCLLMTKKNVWYKKFDKDLNILFSKALSVETILGKDGGQYRLYDVEFKKDNIKLYLYQFKRKHKQFRFYAVGMDYDGSEFKERKILDEANEDDFENSNYNIFYCENVKCKLFITNIKKKESNNIIFKAKLLDSNDVFVWEDTIKLPWLEQQYRLMNYFIDNNKNLVVIGMIQPYLEDMKVNKYEKCVMDIYDGKNEKPISEFIKFENNYITNVFIYSLNKDTIAIVGTCGNKIEKEEDQINNYLASTFMSYYDINKQKFIYSKKSNIITNAMSEKTKKWKFSIVDFFQMENGNYIMVFEQTGSASGEYITYYCNDILIVCIDSVGKFMWSNRIEKKQAEKYFLKFARYRILYKENKMYIIYNAGYERKSFFYVNCFEDEMIYIAEVAQEGTVKIRPIEAPDRAICDLASVIYDPKSDFMHFIVTYPLNGINYKDIRVAKFKLKDLEIN